MSRISAISDEDVANCIRSLLTLRDPGSSICPSDVARKLAPDTEEAWRALMPRVRSISVEMAKVGKVQITRGQTILNPPNIEGGPIRLRRGDRFGKANFKGE